MITKSIGKNTLGGGNKMNVNLRTYNRSTHNLSHVWRNTQSVGTLVPFLVEPALPGDTHEIKLNANVMTHPTVGPLFGSFKLQLDVFSCPIRLYQAKLHNNALGIGLDMSKVELPYLSTDATGYANKSSSLLSYIGIRGVEQGSNGKFNAVPYLAYWDIFKNYYANKQEKNANYIGGSTSVIKANIRDKSNLNIFDEEKIKGDGTSINFGRKNVLVTKTGPIVIDVIWNAKPRATINNENIKVGVLDSVGADVKDTTEIALEKIGSYDNNTSKLSIIADTIVNKYIEYVKFDIDPIQISQFPLENCDIMREEILKGTTSITVEASTKNLYPYRSAITYTQDEDWEAINGSKCTQFQLALKTYQSDIFNNWIQTEWIDGDNGINAITAIDTKSGEFTLDTLNMAKKVYDMLNRIALSGGTYQDWIETVYTNNYIERSETPIYEGGMSQEIVFQEVISQSASGDEPLGSLAGRGTLAEGSRKGGIIKIKTSEPSFIIGIVSITPRIDYSQGNAYWNKWVTMNDLHKPALDGIGFQDLLENKMAWWGTGAVGKQPAWLDYMTAVNRVYGNFAAGENESFMILDRNYERTNDNIHIKDLTTYIDPSKWNGIFADQSLGAMNFWVQIGIGMQARRVMSAKMIPNL